MPSLYETTPQTGTVSSANSTSLYSNTADFTTGLVNSSVYSVNGGIGVTVNPTTGNVVVSIGQDVATTASPAFAGLNIDSGTLYVDSTNNRVGINNTNPQYELHIDQGADGFTQLAMTTAERTTLLTMNDGDDLLSLSYGPTYADNRLQFSPTNQWFVTGNTGFNTTTPAYTLDVNGQGNFQGVITGGLKINGSTSGYSNFIAPTTGSNLNYQLPGTAGAVNSVLTNNGSGVLSWALPGGGGSTFGNITIAVATDNTISTTTGDLILDSASGTVELDGIVNIKGDFLNLNSDNSAVDSSIRFNSGAAIDYNYAAGQFETTRKLVVDGTVELNNTLTINGLTSGYTSFNAPATGSNLAYTLPGTAGAVNTVLTNDGSGNLSWALPGGGGSTFGNITIAIVDDNTIATTTGNLILGNVADTTNWPVINSAAATPVTIQRFSSAVNSNVRSLALNVQSTGTPAVGFGNSLEFQVEAQPSNTERAGYISVTSTDLTSGSEDFKMSFGLMQNGATYTEKAYLDSAGNFTADGEVAGTQFVAGGLAYFDASSSFTTSTTIPNQVASATSASTIRSLKYQYQITSGTEYQAVEIMIIHDGTNAYLNTYSDVRTGANLSTFDADISGGNIRLLVTPTNAVTTYKGIVTAVAV